MKKLNTVIACALGCLMMMSSVVAQENLVCGMPDVSSKWTDQYLATRGAYSKTDALLYVPMTVHIVGSDSGEGYTPINSILNALCTMNEDFVEANIQFYIQGNFRYINDSDFFDHSSLGVGYAKHDDYGVSNTINCYIVSNAGDAAGYATGINSNGVVIRKAEMQTGNHTWAHEIGHALSLYHPFRGWEGQDFNYENTAPERIGGRLVERLDGSNCSLAADGFCDTSPDYLSNRWNCDEGGKSIIVQKDPSGQTFKSDGSNIMSYSSDPCQNKFSEEQIQAMRANLQSVKSNFLNQSMPAPLINDLTAAPVLPGKGEDIDVNAAFLQWEAVPDASLYLIDVSIVPTFAGPITDTYTSNTNSITLTDLTNNRVYYWRVKAINRNSFCTRYGSSSNFRTTTLTDVNEIAGSVDNIRLFPNPLPEGQALTLLVEAANSTNLDVRMFDLAGKLVQYNSYDVLAGESTLQFIPNQVAKGMYLLQIVTDTGTLTKRISIQ